jgi:hypothetical protein
MRWIALLSTWGSLAVISGVDVPVLRMLSAAAHGCRWQQLHHLYVGRGQGLFAAQAFGGGVSHSFMFAFLF